MAHSKAFRKLQCFIIRVKQTFIAFIVDLNCLNCFSCESVKIVKLFLTYNCKLKSGLLYLVGPYFNSRELIF